MVRIDKGLAAIIPTKDRPEDLYNLLNSISRQGVWPGQIIIVDSGDKTLKNVISDFNFFDIHYLKHKPPSLPEQRNIGLGLLRDEIRIVSFFDDDISLCQNAIDTVMKFWQGSCADTAAVACNNISHPRDRVSFIERFFLIGSDRVGIVLPSGFQSKLCSLDRDYQVKWLIGGATFWRRDIFSSYKFDEWFCGYAHCEDIDFSYGVSKAYKLFVLRDARVIHLTKPIRSNYEYHMGVMQVANRVYFVKKHPELSLALCYWACLGLFLKNMFLGIIGCRPNYLLRGFGILAGIFTSFFKDTRIKEKIKS